MATEPLDDTEHLKHQRHFLHEVEKGIREANVAIIHGLIPELGPDSFLRFATVVARLRADYLQAALHLSRAVEQDAARDEALGELRRHREAYEEARAAFDALQRAIEKGYVDMRE
jgi:hypothetical protein